LPHGLRFVDKLIPSVNDTGKNFSLVSSLAINFIGCVNVTRENYSAASLSPAIIFTGVNNTGDKFITGSNYTGNH
jgi:hypothetical protein